MNRRCAPRKENEAMNDETQTPSTTPDGAASELSAGLGLRDIVDVLRDSQPDGTRGGLLLNDAADEIARLRARIDSAPAAIMDTRDALGICAPAEEDFPALYALQGKMVRLVLDERPNAVELRGCASAPSSD